MFTLIKNAIIYAPEFLGKKDVLIAFDRIAAVGENLQCILPSDAEIIDAEGKLLMPGFIDQHVHITGGGGEGGFGTRTREINIEDIIECGITTVVGVLGTDGITRTPESLYAKAKALEEEGLSTYMYIGSYRVPVVTITGDIQRDIAMIDKVVGVGEVAVSDHRSSQPTVDELARIASEARLGGMLSGKAGVVHLHMGDGASGLDPIMKVIATTPIPITQFVPTHVNRNERLFHQSLDFVRAGGNIDVSAGYEPRDPSDTCIPAYKALKVAFASGIDENHISLSSDGNGSIPVFDSRGKLIKIEVGSCKVLLEDMCKAVFDYGIPMEKVLKAVTSNPAGILKFDGLKGSISRGKHADLVLADRELKVDKVFAKGKLLVDNGKYNKSV